MNVLVICHLVPLPNVILPLLVRGDMAGFRNEKKNSIKEKKWST